MVEDDLCRHRQTEGALNTLCLAGFTIKPEMPLLTVLLEERCDAAGRTWWQSIGLRPLHDLKSSDLVELRPLCFGVRNSESLTPDCVADAKDVLLVGFWPDGHFEPVTGHAIDLSIKDQHVSLVLMGWDLIEGTDQADASLDADNCASEVDLIHVLFDRYRVPIQNQLAAQSVLSGMTV